jgi:hypothetical protein
MSYSQFWKRQRYGRNSLPLTKNCHQPREGLINSKFEALTSSNPQCLEGLMIKILNYSDLP